MRVTILFFAAAREAVGQSKVTVDLPETVANIEGFTDWLGKNYPVILPFIDFLRIAQNEQFAGPNTPLSEGDTLAVIPPVAGG
jgi:molybdopterin converting factor subunit 1